MLITRSCPERQLRRSVVDRMGVPAGAMEAGEGAGEGAVHWLCPCKHGRDRCPEWAALSTSEGVVDLKPCRGVRVRRGARKGWGCPTYRSENDAGAGVRQGGAGRLGGVGCLVVGHWHWHRRGW